MIVTEDIRRQFLQGLQKFCDRNDLNFPSWANLKHEDAFVVKIHDDALDLKAEAETKGHFGNTLEDFIAEAILLEFVERKWMVIK